ncbi:hypothetical protein ACFFGT_04930 [Mucilaginibacter angelicae]|uniref:Uncharacterized protein n=1 Tax=Mucilaginibacter angelicae TaxID=869718 RepID=A0ABV6L1C4_9SPHI
MPNRQIYILHDLNAALILDQQRWFYFDGLSGDLNEIDHVIYSQLQSIKPDAERIDLFKEENRRFRSERSTLDNFVHFSKGMPLLTEIIAQHLKENRNNNLSRALQLMDDDLSTTYRKALAELIYNDIRARPNLLPVLYRNLYSTVLPRSLRPTVAIAVISPSFIFLKELYQHIDEQSHALAMAESILKKGLPISMDDWPVIDAYLKQNGFYYNLGAAIRYRSKYLIRYSFEKLGSWINDVRFFSFSDFHEDIPNLMINRLEDLYDLRLENDRNPTLFSFPSISHHVLRTEHDTFENTFDAIKSIGNGITDYGAYFKLLLENFGPYSSILPEQMNHFLLKDLDGSRGSSLRNVAKIKRRSKNQARPEIQMKFTIFNRLKIPDNLFILAENYEDIPKSQKELSKLWLIAILNYFLCGDKKEIEESLTLLIRKMGYLVRSRKNAALRPHLFLAKFKLAWFKIGYRRFSPDPTQSCLQELAKFDKLNKIHNWYYLDSAGIFQFLVKVFNPKDPKNFLKNLPFLTTRNPGHIGLFRKTPPPAKTENTDDDDSQDDWKSLL